MSIDPKSDYYDAGGIEVIDIIRAKLTPEQFTGYLLGNAIKYILRANHKGDFERDLDKARVYIGQVTDAKASEPPARDWEQTRWT